MDGMGYRNAKKVYALASQGRLNRERDGVPVVNSLALHMMLYMALTATDLEAADDNNPPRVYWAGWSKMAEELGMTPGVKDFLDPDLTDSEIKAIIVRRKNTARNRLSQTARWMRENGLIKQLVPANSYLGRNAAWLLLLGDDAENREVEAWARRCLRLPEG